MISLVISDIFAGMSLQDSAEYVTSQAKLWRLSPVARDVVYPYQVL